MIFFSMYIKCLSPWKPGMHQSQSYNKTVLFITAEDVKSLLRSCKRTKLTLLQMAPPLFKGTYILYKLGFFFECALFAI